MAGIHGVEDVFYYLGLEDLLPEANARIFAAFKEGFCLEAISVLRAFHFVTHAPKFLETCSASNPDDPANLNRIERVERDQKVLWKITFKGTPCVLEDRRCLRCLFYVMAKAPDSVGCEELAQLFVHGRTLVSSDTASSPTVLGTSQQEPGVGCVQEDRPLVTRRIVFSVRCRLTGYLGKLENGQRLEEHEIGFVQTVGAMRLWQQGPRLDEELSKDERQRLNSSEVTRKALETLINVLAFWETQLRPPRGQRERDRQAIQKQLAAARKRIAEMHPELGEHLRRYLKVGVECSDKPPQDRDSGRAPKWVLPNAEQLRKDLPG